MSSFAGATSGARLRPAEAVAAGHPDVVQRLTALAAATESDLGTKGVGPGCRPLGRVAHPLPIIGLDGTVRPELAGPQKRFP